MCALGNTSGKLILLSSLSLLSCILLGGGCKLDAELGAVENELDCVFCIDKSGAMLGDIQAFKTCAASMLTSLDSAIKAEGLSLRVGLVTYSNHDEDNWIQARTLTSDLDGIRGHIRDIKVEDTEAGDVANGDMYAAMMYAMNQTVGGKQTDMGWRPGAAKIIVLIPKSDEPAPDPDWENRTLADVVRAARDLDRVHVYPIIMHKKKFDLLDPAVRAMKRVARATGGQVIRLGSIKDLPLALVASAKFVAQRQRNLVWRKGHRPYPLYGVLAATMLVVVAAPLGLLIQTLLWVGASADEGTAAEEPEA